MEDGMSDEQKKKQAAELAEKAARELAERQQQAKPPAEPKHYRLKAETGIFS